MKHHNKNTRPGQQKTLERMADDFDPPTDFNDWLDLAQVMQARALDMPIPSSRAICRSEMRSPGGSWSWRRHCFSVKNA